MPQSTIAPATVGACKTQSFADQRTRCEVWTRVMGYHRPVTNFNIGKKSEHYSRKHFSEAHSLNSSFCKKYS
jgi:hypothetical protein